MFDCHSTLSGHLIYIFDLKHWTASKIIFDSNSAVFNLLKRLFNLGLDLKSLLFFFISTFSFDH